MNVSLSESKASAALGNKLIPQNVLNNLLISHSYAFTCGNTEETISTQRGLKGLFGEIRNGTSYERDIIWERLNVVTCEPKINTTTINAS